MSIRVFNGKLPRPDKDGYSPWIAPIQEKYRMGCCDCGLVHELDFRVVRIIKNSDYVDITDIIQNAVAIFRVRRANRMTHKNRRTMIPKIRKRLGKYLR